MKKIKGKNIKKAGIKREADKFLSKKIREQLDKEGYIKAWFSEQLPKKCINCPFLYERHLGLYVCKYKTCRRV